MTSTSTTTSQSQSQSHSQSQSTSTSTSTSNSALTSTSNSEPLRSLFIHTHNVARTLKPSADGELANSIHETLHFALDGEEEDWGIRNQDKHQHQPGCGEPTTTSTTTSTSTAKSNRNVKVNQKDQSLSSKVKTEEGEEIANERLASADDDDDDDDDDEDETQNQNSDLPKARPGFFLSSNPSRPYISYSWDSKNKTLSLPNPTLISNPTQLDPCSPEKRNDFDVTVKLFFLGNPNQAENQTDKQVGFDESYIEQALNRLTLTTGLITVDTLILAFPGMKFDTNVDTEKGSNDDGGVDDNDEGRKVEIESLDKDVQLVRKLWEVVSPHPQCISLGLSDFSLPSLKSLFNSFSPSLSPITPTSINNSIPSISEVLKKSESESNESDSSIIVSPTLREEEEEEGGGSISNVFTTPSKIRRPRVVTINVKENPCSFDKELSLWCQNQGMQVLSHGDRKDILPEHTLNSLLSEFQSDLPNPLPKNQSLKAKWVLKYSVLIQGRGVIADKGYIVYADVL